MACYLLFPYATLLRSLLLVMNFARDEFVERGVNGGMYFTLALTSFLSPRERRYAIVRPVLTCALSRASRRYPGARILVARILRRELQRRRNTVHPLLG